jgi:hypothetical protein
MGTGELLLLMVPHGHYWVVISVGSSGLACCSPAGEERAPCGLPKLGIDDGQTGTQLPYRPKDFRGGILSEGARRSHSIGMHVFENWLFSSARSP